MITDQIPDGGGAMALGPGGLSIHASLPDSLSRQFDSLERRLWRLDALVAATGSAGSLLLSWLMVFVSDRIWDSPHWLRLLLAAAGWGGFAVFAIGYGNRWIWAKPSVRSLAMIVQRRYRRLGDRLLGIVELADPQARPSNYSAELCRAAIAQVAGEASSFDFRQAAVRQRPMRQLLAFAGLALLVTGLSFILPDAARNAFARWFAPSSNTARYTFVSIEPLPEKMVVAQGEAFDVSLKLQPHSWWRPLSARAHFQGAPAVNVAVRDGVAKFNLPGQTQERMLSISIGDVTKSIRIQPMVRPDLQSLDAEIHLPGYLQYPVQKTHIETGSLSFLPGTTAKFSGVATQELASARVEGEKPLKLDVNGKQFSGGPLLLEMERDIQFTWHDKFGLSGLAPMTIHAIPTEDEPPHVELSGIEPAVGILAEETVHLDLSSSDDYGVQRLQLTWQRAAASPNDPPGPVHEIMITKGQPQAKTLGGHFALSPALLGIEANTTLLVRAQAADYYPTRNPSVSTIYRIHVLDRQAHAQLIHDQFEKLMEQLEELARRQAALLQAGKAVRGQIPQQLAGDNSAQKLGQQSSDQRQTASDLAKLAKQMAATLSEAMRNPEITPETLKAWAGHAQQMNQLASSSMPAAAQSLDSAKSQSQPASRAQNLDQALAQEQKILDAMRQMETKGSKDLENLMAKTLAARLRHVAESERGLASDFLQMLPDTVGLTAEQLPADARAKLQTMSTSHTAAAQEASRLQSEIARLYDRTSLDNYGSVAKEMIAWKTEDGMAALGKLVDQDIAVQSIETARYWSDQFNHWASKLEQEDPSKSGKSGQPGQPDPAQMKALMALMQLRQRQDQLREQTAAIEEQMETLSDYKLQAEDAHTQQSTLRDTVNALAQDPSFPIPAAKLLPVGKAMDDAAVLLARPETGKSTYEAQTDAINLLDNAIAQQSQKSGQSASGMAALMGMGGTHGGTTNKRNVATPGSREGTPGEQRTVIQAGGVDNSELPGEFRDAIEGYQRAVDQSQ